MERMRERVNRMEGMTERERVRWRECERESE